MVVERSAVSFRMSRTVAERAAALGVTHVHLSITHDSGIASAFVICEAADVAVHTAEQVRAADTDRGASRASSCSGPREGWRGAAGRAAGRARSVLLLVGPGNNRATLSMPGDAGGRRG